MFPNIFLWFPRHHHYARANIDGTIIIPAPTLTACYYASANIDGITFSLARAATMPAIHQWHAAFERDNLAINRVATMAAHYYVGGTPAAMLMAALLATLIVPSAVIYVATGIPAYSKIASCISCMVLKYFLCIEQQDQ